MDLALGCRGDIVGFGTMTTIVRAIECQRWPNPVLYHRHPSFLRLQPQLDQAADGFGE